MCADYRRFRGFPGRVAGIVLLAGCSCGIGATEPVFDLEPYTVRNGPVIEEIDLTRSGEALTRVGREQVHTLGAGDLAAALRRVPGVTISRYNVVGAFGGGDGGAVFIRGQGSGRPGAQIVTLTDGIPRFVGVWTHPLLDTLPTDFSSAIEVHKSAQPVRFGNMAFGAVNLLPARAVEDGWSGSTRIEYGSWDTRSLYASAAYRDEQVNLHAALSRRESDGHRPDASGEVNAGQLRAAWATESGWDLGFLAQVVSSDALDPGRKGEPLPVVGRYEIENQFILAEAGRRTGDWEFRARAYLEAGELDWRQWHTPPPPPFPAQVLNTLTDYGNHGARLHAAYEGERMTLAGGVDLDSYGGRVTEVFAGGATNRFNEERFHLVAPHLMLEWDLVPAREGEWILSLGARYFGHDSFADELGGQAGLRYRTDRLTAYANAARGLNYPGVFVSVFGRRPHPWSVGLEWKRLEAETIDHFESGIQARIGEGLVVNAAVFRDEVGNALRIAAPPPVGRILNLGGYTVQGAEISLQGAVRETVRLFGAATYLDADETVPNAPEWTLVAGAEWQPARGFRFSADIQYVDRQRILDARFDNPRGTVDAHTLVHLRVSRTLKLEAGDLELYLRGDNLFDEAYEHRPGYPMPGASVTAGMRLRY